MLNATVQEFSERSIIIFCNTSETAFPDGAEPLEAAQEIICDYLSREGVKFSHQEGDRAFYRPATYEVVLPMPH